MANLLSLYNVGSNGEYGVFVDKDTGNVVIRQGNATVLSISSSGASVTGTLSSSGALSPASLAVTSGATVGTTLGVTGAATLGDALTVAGAGAANGEGLVVTSSTEELTGLSGATASTTGLIPAGSLLLGLTTRVTTTITGPTDFDIGDGTDVNAFGAAISITGDTTTDFTDWTIVAAPVYASATEVVLTANGGSFSTGAVRVTAIYATLTAPIS